MPLEPCRILGAAAVAAALLLSPACSSSDAAKSDADRAPVQPAATPDDSVTAPRQPTTAAPRVTLSPAAYANADIEIASPTVESAGAPSGALEVPAVIELDPARLAIVSSRAAGRLERVVPAPGERVAAGTPVAYLTSPAYLTAQSDYLQAHRRVASLAGTADEPGARALLEAARDRLELLGTSKESVAHLDTGGTPSLLLPVPAPFGGSVLETLALPGTALEPGTPIIRLADLSAVDAVAQVPERALAVVRVGQTVSLSVPAYPATRFVGRVVRLRDVVDSTTRTVGTIVRVPNGDHRLRPGMFVTARLAVPAGMGAGGLSTESAGGRLIVVPEEAVVTDGARRYVFVAVGPRAFQRREVTLAPLTPPGSTAPASGRLVVRSGLGPAERIAVQGAFILESELAKSRLGEGDE